MAAEGGQVKATNCKGETALGLAVSGKAGEAVVGALLQAGADVKVLRPELQQACKDGDVAKVKEMIIALERSPDWSQTINSQHNVSNGPRPVSVTEAALTLSLTGLQGGIHAAAQGHLRGPSSRGGPTTGTRS